MRATRMISIAAVAAVAAAAATAGAQGPLIHDDEQNKLVAQHGERWAQEDREITMRLGEIRAANGNRPPNIVYVLLDDLGFGEIGMPSLDVIRGYSTPNISAFEKESLSFQRMYTEASCTPSRVSFLTGRLAVRTGFSEAKSMIEGVGLPDWEVTLAEVLSEAGYNTVHVGKWHLGDIEESYAFNQGFEYAEHPLHQQGQMAVMNRTAEIEGSASGIAPNSRATDFELDTTFRVDPNAMVYGIVGRKGGQAREVNFAPGEEYTQDHYIRMETGYKDAAIEQIRRLADEGEPFFLQWWPQFPLTWTKSEIDQARTLNGGPIAEGIAKVDDWFGELLEAIDDAGIADNTIVIIMGDNGPFMQYVRASGQSDRIYRGGKAQHLEGGVRVNAFMRWPDAIEPGSSVQDIVHITDLFTTLATLAGADRNIPRDRLIDGVNQAPLLFKGETHGRRDYVFVYEGPVLKSVVKQQFKMHIPPPGANPIGAAIYDLYKDPRESRPENSILYGVGYGARFVDMVKRHMATKMRYPDREPGRGVPYGGITNLRPESKELVNLFLTDMRRVKGE